MLIGRNGRRGDLIGICGGATIFGKGPDGDGAATAALDIISIAIASTIDGTDLVGLRRKSIGSCGSEIITGTNCTVNIDGSGANIEESAATCTAFASREDSGTIGGVMSDHTGICGVAITFAVPAVGSGAARPSALAAIFTACEF